MVVWQNGQPIAQKDLPGVALPMDTAQLRRLIGDEVSATEKVSDGSPDRAEWNSTIAEQSRTGAKISVIICSHDRPNPLARCLSSLAAMARPADEIIVVDNAPTTPATQHLCATRFPRVRYLKEPRKGLDIARNGGIEAALGDIVALTDDDVLVDPHWLQWLERAFADPAIMAVTGLILPSELDTPAQWQFEQYWSLNRGYVPATFGDAFFQRFLPYGVPTWSLGAGANMAFRKTIFAEVGTFDERLDAGAAGCCGDSEILYRLLADGFCCRYEPRAVVHHTHRRNDGDYRRQIAAYMRGHATALLIQFERYRHWGNIHRLFTILPRFYGRLVLSGLRHGFGARRATVGTEVWGLVSGIAFYLRRRRSRPSAAYRPVRQR